MPPYPSAPRIFIRGSAPDRGFPRAVWRRRCELLRADDVQESQLLSVLGAGRGGVDEQELGVALGHERLAVQRDLADLRMQEALALLGQASRDVVLGPERGERRAGGVQRRDQREAALVVWAARHRHA